MRLQAENERLWPGHPVTAQQRQRLVDDRDELDGVGLARKLRDREREFLSGDLSTAYMIARLYQYVGDNRAAIVWLNRAPVKSA